MKNTFRSNILGRTPLVLTALSAAISCVTALIFTAVVCGCTAVSTDSNGDIDRKTAGLNKSPDTSQNYYDDEIECRICTDNNTGSVSSYDAGHDGSATGISTKVELGDISSDSVCPILWNSGDRITVLSEDGTCSSYTTVCDKTREARFRYDDNSPDNSRITASEKYLALYPEAAWDSQGVLTIPSVQSNASNSGNGLFFPMCSESSDSKTFEFSGLCGLFRLRCNSLSESVEIQEVSLYANENIGNIRINYSSVVTVGDIGIARVVEAVGSVPSDNATKEIHLKLPEKTTIDENPCDFLFTILPGEYTGAALQLTLATGKILIYPIAGILHIRKNVMNTLSIPIDAFFQSDRPCSEIGSLNVAELKYVFNCSASDVNFTDSAESGTIVLNSSKRCTFNDSTEWGTGVPVDIDYSTDDGSSFSSTRPPLLSEFSINNASDNEGNYEIGYTFSDSTGSCIVRLTQRVSGKELRIQFTRD